MVVILTIVLAGRVLEVEYSTDRTVVGLLLAVGILFPLSLLVAVIMGFVRLQRERRAGNPGGALKMRLSAFFALIVFLVAVPQGVVSIAFLSSALSVLFQTETNTSLRSGLDITVAYYDSQVQLLERVVLPRLRGTGRAGDRTAFEAIWAEVRTMVPTAHSLVVYNADGSERFAFGRLEDQLPGGVARTLRADGVTRTGGETGSLLRLVARSTGAQIPEEQLVVVSAQLPPGFDEAARRLTRSVELFSRLERLRPTFVLAVGGLYLGFASPIFLLALLAGFFLSDQVIRPIESLEAATRRVAEGDYSVRILTPAGDNLGLLVLSFNRMVLELDRTRRKIAQTEKVAAWQEIAQRLAHEIKNPLTPIRLAAERLRRKYEVHAEDFDQVLERTVETIIREVEGLNALLNEFRSFARMPQPAIQPTGIRSLVLEAVATFAGVPDVTFDYREIDDSLSVAVDPQQMRQVFVNLFTNSIEAADGPVLIRVSTSLVKRMQTTYCRIRIEDDGPGIAPELRESLFQPYVTGKPHGTGLGLAIVDRILFDHEGRIAVESALGSGATFLLDLPMDET